MKTAGVLILILLLPLHLSPAQWQATAPLPGGSAISVVLGASKIFACNGNSVFLSRDHGLSWNSISAGLTDSSVSCMALSGTKLFAGTARGSLFVSTDDGVSWSGTGYQGGAPLLALALDGTTLYMGITGGGLQRSTDDGATWEAIPGTANYCNSITINGSVIMARMNAPGYYLSMDHGVSWNWVAGSLGVRSAAAIGTDLYVGTASDVQRSTDYGATWSRVINGLPSTEITALAAYETNLFAAARGYGVFLTTDNGANWNQVGSTISDSLIGFFTLSTLEIYAGGDALWQRRIGEMVIPLPPEALAATDATSSSFLAHWSASTLATRYRLDVATNNLFTDPVTNYFNIFVAGTSDTVEGLTPATNYFYRLRAVDMAGESGNSNYIRAVTVPLPPVALDPIAVSSREFTAAWSTVTGAGGYYLDVSTDSTFGTYLGVFRGKDIGNVTSYVVDGLDPGMTVYYRVRSHNAGGASSNSNTVKVSTIPYAPSAPLAKLPTNPRTTGFSANWDSVDGAATYRLDVADNAGFDSLVFPYIGLDVGNVTTCDVTGLNPGTAYYYRVKAANAGGPSVNSNVITTATLTLAPTARDPSSVTSGGFTANWDTVAGATGYQLDVSTTSGFGSNLREYDSRAVGNVTSCAVSGLQGATTYFYRVRGVNAGGASASSNVDSASTLPGGPDAPVATDPSTRTTTEFTARWISVASATGYQLDVSTDNGFGSMLKGYDSCAVGNVTSHTVVGLQEATTYFYRVRGVNAGGVSQNSNVVSTTTLRSHPSTYTVQTTVAFSAAATKLSDYRSQDYMLIGIPGNSGQSFGAFLGGVQGTDWEVYWDNGSPVDYPGYYVRYSASDQNFKAATGKAFWLLHRGDWVLSSQTVPTATLDTGGSATVTLSTDVGFNLITNPFMYSIPWSRITAANGISDSLRAWTTSGWVKASSFDPYRGYLFFNGGGRSSLRIPLAATVPKAAPPRPDGGWRVDVIARCGQLRDETTSFGINANAAEGIDCYEQRKPRHFRGIPDVFFQHPEWDEKFPEFATDIRPSVADVQVWDLVLRSEERRSVDLEFIGLEQIPVDLGVTLLDEKAGRAQDLRSGTKYTVQPVNARTSLRVAVGKKEALQKLVTQVLPTEYVMLQNYPNPFNPTTTVPVVVPQESFITVSVYDILGRAVRTLHEGSVVPGRYYFEWDGRNERGMGVSSGVYFTRLSVKNGVTRVVRMSLIR